MQDEHLRRGHERVYAHVLKRYPDLHTNLMAMLCDIESAYEGCSRSRSENRGEDLHRRGLSRAVRAEEREDLRGTDYEVDSVDGCHRSERASEALSDNAALFHVTDKILTDLPWKKAFCDGRRGINAGRRLDGVLLSFHDLS